MSLLALLPTLPRDRSGLCLLALTLFMFPACGDSATESTKTDSSGGNNNGAGGSPGPESGGTPGSSGGGVGTESSGGRSEQGEGSGGLGSGGVSDAGTGGSPGGGAASGGAASTGGTPSTGGASPGPQETTISWGTSLSSPAVVDAARALASELAAAPGANWQAKGDQKRTYRFETADADVPFRVCVPTAWDGISPLPLALFLHGAGNDESSYLDQNNKQMVNLADQHGYVLVSPLGYQGAYGSFLRLPAVFGERQAADDLVSAKTAATEHDQELSEQDVINVLEIVLAEYPIARDQMFLMGHSMGSGGTWYLGAKYSFYWRGIAPMSGPFVQEAVYPWDRMMSVPMFVTEGTNAASIDGSRVLRDWLSTNGYPSEYKEVMADHAGMVSLVLPDVFDFFDRMKGQP